MLLVLPRRQQRRADRDCDAPNLCDSERDYKIKDRDDKGMSKDDVTACAAATSVWCFHEQVMTSVEGGRFESCFGAAAGCKAEHARAPRPDSECFEKR